MADGSGSGGGDGDEYGGPAAPLPVVFTTPLPFEFMEANFTYWVSSCKFGFYAPFSNEISGGVSAMQSSCHYASVVGDLNGIADALVDNTACAEDSGPEQFPDTSVGNVVTEDPIPSMMTVMGALCEHDSDGDGHCDAQDVCPGHDDSIDSDSDGTPDGCDVCPTPDDPTDSDGDGICDGVDTCPMDPQNDIDGDGACANVDPCPLDNPDDSDGDLVCDTNDLCPGHNDTLDRDFDLQPDACDPCPEDNPDDTDGDGVCDSLDACRYDAANDEDEDGVCADQDNCPTVANAGQEDEDDDGDGDACDTNGFTPADCVPMAGQPSGIYKIWPLKGKVTLAYCDTTQDPPAASVFYIPGGPENFKILNEESVCVLEYGGFGDYGENSYDADDNDNHIMWLDGTTFHNGYYDEDALHGEWFQRWTPDGKEDKRYVKLPGIENVPAAFGLNDDDWEYASVIPFYAADIVVWVSFDTMLLWWDGLAEPMDLEPLCPCCASGHSDMPYFAFDAVNTVTLGSVWSVDSPSPAAEEHASVYCEQMGLFPDGQNLTDCLHVTGGWGKDSHNEDYCARTLKFDFDSGRVQAWTPENVFPEHRVQKSVEENAFGEQLPTVNGRVFRYHDELNMALDGTATDPWRESPEDMTLLQGLGYDDDTGLDFLGHVDDMGRVWMTDYGHDGACHSVCHSVCARAWLRGRWAAVLVPHPPCSPHLTCHC